MNLFWIFVFFWIFFGFFLFFGRFLDFGIFLNFLKFFEIFGIFFFFSVTNVTTKSYQGCYWRPKNANNGPKQYNKLFFCPKGYEDDTKVLSSLAKMRKLSFNQYCCDRHKDILKEALAWACLQMAE